MRVIGRRIERPPGPRWPTADEVRHSKELSQGVKYRHEKGVVRYRSHAEANGHMQEIVADAMVDKSLELAGRTK